MASDSKHTKRVRDGQEEMSLDARIAQKRGALVMEREEAPRLREQARHMAASADAMTRRFERRSAAELRAQARDLEAEADVRESMTREHAFEANVVTYLRRYHSKVEPCTNANHYVARVEHQAKRRVRIVDEYLTEINCAPPKVAMAARDECPRCAVRLLLCSARSMLSCPDCGYAITYLDATSTSTNFDEMVEYSQYSYKRINHFTMWLALVQGKETHRVDDDTLARIMSDLYHRQGIARAVDITNKRVRETLRRLKMRKAYDNVAQITQRLSGVQASRVTPQQEEKLRNMFMQIQPAFQRHAPSTRTNFLSYSYVLYRCFQVLKLDHMLDTVTLLKGRDKLENNDIIFRKIAKDLGWSLPALPPLSETS
jgi:hypothetical protein